MFKWRNDHKNKITAIFKLQFHATQVQEVGENGLVISVVPAENGKPTAKLEKCVIKEKGNCYWETPVYETVKFIQDTKTGKIHDRIYYFLISTVGGGGGGGGGGSSSLVGEFCVNISDYAAATKACSVSFPFKGSNSESHLHVLIQRVQESSTYQRDFEEVGSPKGRPEDRSLRRHFSNGDLDEGLNTSSIEEEPLRKTVSHMPGYNGARRGSSGSDITLSSTDSSSGLNTPRQIVLRSIHDNGDQNSNGLNSHQDQPGGWELAIVPVNGSATDYSMNSPRDIYSSERSQMGADESIEKLKADLVILSRKAEVSELELQTLRKQIVKESKKGQDLVRENSSLKEERDVLKTECEKLQRSQKRSDDLKAKSKFEGDPLTILEEVKEELNYEKDINSNLRLQLQKTQEANSELLLAIQDLEDMLEKNNGGVSDLPNRSRSGESTVEMEESILKCQSSDDDEEQKALEDLVRQHSDAQEAYLLEQKVMDLCSEIEMYRRDKDELEIQLEQLALDYEILKQENHEYSSRLEQCHLQDQLKSQNDCSSTFAVKKELEAQKERLHNELIEQSEELSYCIATIKDLEVRNQSLEKELERQAQAFESDKEALSRTRFEQEERAVRAEVALTQSNATVSELESQLEKLKKELNRCSQELSGSFATVKELEIQNHNLEEELTTQAHNFEAEMESLGHAKMEQEHRALDAEEAVVRCNATINDLEQHIKKLENELNDHTEGSSDTLMKMKELEAHIHDLEEELEKQAEGFEADLEVVTHAKVEQEQRAIKAEEALRLVRWKNSNTAARIQDEFKRLSSQMQSSFEANEKLASKALTEASELRMQNRLLQDTLQKANEELQSSKEEYETKLRELSNQINMKSVEVEEMLVEMENQTKHVDEVENSAFSQKLDLKAEIERLTLDNKILSEQSKQVEKLESELQYMKSLLKEREEENVKRDNLENSFVSVNSVSGKSLENSNGFRHLTDEKEHLSVNLQSEVENLSAHCDELKHSVQEDELEKEKLRMQIFQLNADLKKKDDAIATMEKKLKEANGRVVVHDRSKATSSANSSKSETGQRGSKDVASKEVTTLKEHIKLLEAQIKSKEASMKTSANAFFSKETELKGKIAKLEVRLGELDQSSPASGHNIVKEEMVSVGMQVDCNAEEAGTSNADLDSDEQTSSETQEEAPKHGSVDQQKFDILLKEMVLLKETNNLMETELKEMQERYSEISLKFAEVEGERQQLVMRVRSLRNAKKS